MNHGVDGQTFWTLDLERKPDFEMAMRRIYAWYAGEIDDRPPIRFSRHNVEYETANDGYDRHWATLREQWLDVDYQIEKFKTSLRHRSFLGETFPIYWPNLGPDVYAAFYGATLEFGEVTSWSKPFDLNREDILELKLNMDNLYFRKLEELTERALVECEGEFIVGYTDLHPGLDCVAAWRGQESFCLDFYENPQGLKALAALSVGDFHRIYDHFDSMLKAKKQPSVTWMGIPSFGKMHIPSCDAATLISPELYREYGLPILQQEVVQTTHNIFHLDGRGVARHLDAILEVPEITAIQWVQGVGDDLPIMQWIPLIKKIRAAGKSVVVDLTRNELDDFMEAVSPEGILLCLASETEDEERAILKRIERWT